MNCTRRNDKLSPRSLASHTDADTLEHWRSRAIDEARLLITRTAPNAAHYNSRLIDYNNDPTVTFEDMQRLLKAVETDLTKTASPQEK